MYKLYKQYENIWKCFNPSTKLNAITREVEKHLINYEYSIDIYGNIFIGDFYKKRACLVAHLDSVHVKRSKHITLKKGKLKSENGIGGDDKCGIVAILEILSRNNNVNAIFTVDEEIGGIGASNIQFNDLKNVLYFIEIDRGGKNDIIYTSGFNTIASDDFIDTLEPFTKKYGFKEGFGSFTDVNILTKIAKKSAINVSCGYYNAHTKKEYVKLSELQHTIKFVEDIINNIKNIYVWEDKQLLEYNNQYNDFNYEIIDDILTKAHTLGYDDKVMSLILEAYEIGKNDSYLDYEEIKDTAINRN